MRLSGSSFHTLGFFVTLKLSYPVYILRNGYLKVLVLKIFCKFIFLKRLFALLRIKIHRTTLRQIDKEGIKLQYLLFTDMRSDVQEIFRMTPHEKQVMMFSATLSKDIRPVCKKFMQDVITNNLLLSHLVCGAA